MLYRAKQLEYDDNVAVIIGALAFSMVGTVLLIVMLFRCRQLVLKNRLITFVALIAASPITIALLILNYGKVFGTLAH